MDNTIGPRENLFYSLKTCPVRRAAMGKLTLDDFSECVDFIRDNDHLDYTEFNHQLNVWHLNHKQQSNRLNIMWAMLTEANAIHFTPKQRRQR